MVKLFDKTYDELREAFVRARFAEHAVFGRADIQEWLKEQRLTCLDRTMEGFGRFVDLLVRHAGHSLTSNYLPRYATPVSLTAQWQSRTLTAVGGSIAKLVFALVSSGGQLYPFGDGGPVITLDGEGFVASQEKVALLDNIAFLDVVFAEWSTGGSKADEALTFICDTMDRAISEARQAAQRDFDEAVAVSGDGTEIVKAKWVLVFDRTEWHDRGYLFHGTAFFKNPCQSKLMHRTSVDVEFMEDSLFNNKPLETLVDLFRWTLVVANTTVNYWDSYCFMEKQGTFHGELGSLLAIDACLCPSPLPAGGEEILV